MAPTQNDPHAQRKTAPEVAIETLGMGLIAAATHAEAFPSPKNRPAFISALGVKPWSGHPEFTGPDLLKSILDSVFNETNDRRFTAVESGHGVGKSLIASAIACTWIAQHEEAVVITLAPTHSQVNNVLWRYIRQMHLKAGSHLPGTVFETPRWEINPGRYALGLSPRRASAEDVQALHGYHSTKLLVIMDEAPGLPRILWEAISGLVTAEGNRILALGNPVGQAGPFWEACNNPQWNHIRISCLDHPNVVTGEELIPGATGRAWVREMVYKHCVRSGPAEPGAFDWEDEWWSPDSTFQSKVLGQAPTEGSDQLISLAWVTGAQTWEAEPDDRDPIIMGMDPSRVAHGDAAALVARRGPRVLWVKRRRPRSKNPGAELAGWLYEEWRNLGASRAFIEETGVGSSVVDHARSIGVPVIAVQPGAGAATKQWANKRAECWWRLREALQGGALTIPQDDMLEADLCAPKFWYDGQGRIILEPKTQIKDRLGRSPDSGDALSVTFAVAERRSKGAVDGLATARQLRKKSSWLVSKQPAGVGRWRKLG